ncbi:hypothetical protein Bbelb_370890 [Branchiostoma belcheri]|nr:hypothetical protein Bbelb_370890 [Branchiostoma belcheri]
MQQGPRQFNFELGERPRLRHTRLKLVSLFLAPSHFRPRPGHMVAEHSFRPMGISIVKDPKMTHFDAVVGEGACWSLRPREMRRGPLVTTYRQTPRIATRTGAVLIRLGGL